VSITHPDDPRVEYARRHGRPTGRPAVNTADYHRAYMDWIRRGTSLPPQWHEELVRADQLDRELRDLAAGSNAAGGFTVPPGFIDRLFVGLRRGSAMVRACTVTDTEGGQAATLPLLDDTSVNGSIISEAGPHTVDTATPFASRSLASYLYSSRIVKVSRQLAQDTAFPLERWLPRVLGARIGRAFNTHATVGVGGGTQPAGLLNTLLVGGGGGG
jgi:HK97 family phage major capsid protein